MLEITDFINDLKTNLCCSEKFLMNAMEINERQFSRKLISGDFSFNQITKLAKIYNIN